ncbi:hypothetical protein C823_000699 [Eubacterium plexicaudatum ASF492]|uniref:NAD(P)-binding domain-containing protein n=1 Tax=Eubacterium plexicaudatum ASF492 TaxID=1235802 RepID=N2A290_9FIRM|nr:hypothetical protein C823_000699 [Eubacterium plexicaudatum ASF492]
MDDLMIKNVDIFGDSIMAAKDKDGNIWAGVSYFCRALGMDKKQKDNQVERVQQDDVLKRGAGNVARIRIEVDSEKLRPADVPVMEADISKVQRLTGWKPKISPEQTIGDMLGYWRQMVKDSR